ncbi:hypothetical protein [uncultured Thiodictyon sp.]|uniref:hypothetical protein n=1 Tax=uncultured Thiodictyon sp. TaxID=1846217 RepID=UPI0025CE0938|nr:hypothetical protein [uncultured Thiodictyon sp.]
MSRVLHSGRTAQSSAKNGNPHVATRRSSKPFVGTTEVFRKNQVLLGDLSLFYVSPSNEKVKELVSQFKSARKMRPSFDA